MAVYTYLEENNEHLIGPIDKIEKILNAILLIDHTLLNTINNNLYLTPYLTSQIFKNNLTYKNVIKLYPELQTEIHNHLLDSYDISKVPIKEINTLLLACPDFLIKRTIPLGIDINIVYDYLKCQIKEGRIDEIDLLVLYAYMWKYITDEVE